MTTSAVLPEVILKEAAQVIRTQGWYQSGWSRHRAVCVLEAIFQASEHLSTSAWGAQVELAHRIGRLNPVIWNDAPSRTLEEVLAVLDGA